MNLAPLLNLLSSPTDENSRETIGSKLPFAEVDSDGVVLGVNSLGKIAWGWAEGSHIPQYLELFLESASKVEPSELPLQLGGLMVGLIPEPETGGWIFIGYSPQETNIRDAILTKKKDRLPHGSASISTETPQTTSGKIARRIRKRKKSRSEAKLAFIATLSHEIRSPIGSIAGYTELLSRELTEYQAQSSHELPDLIFEFLHALEERTSSLQRVVQDLFEASKLHKTDLAVDQESTDINVILRRVTDKKISLLQGCPTVLNVELDESSIMVQGDPGTLKQIIGHVLSNAIKFTDSGEIIIRSESCGGSAIVEIEDTGIGISEEFIQEIFDVLSQEDSHRTRRYEGIGMGLALTRRMLDHLGGSIEVKSKKGAGSLFTIQLPLASSGSSGTLNRSSLKTASSSGSHF